MTSALWQSTAKRVAVVVDDQALDDDAAVESAVEGVLFAMWRPEAYRTGEDERQLPPLEEVLILRGTDAGAAGDGVIARGVAIGEAVNWARALSNPAWQA